MTDSWFAMNISTPIWNENSRVYVFDHLKNRFIENFDWDTFENSFEIITKSHFEIHAADVYAKPPCSSQRHGWKIHLNNFRDWFRAWFNSSQNKGWYQQVPCPNKCLLANRWSKVVALRTISVSERPFMSHWLNFNEVLISFFWRHSEYLSPRIGELNICMRAEVTLIVTDFNVRRGVSIDNIARKANNFLRYQLHTEIYVSPFYMVEYHD